MLIFLINVKVSGTPSYTALAVACHGDVVVACVQRVLRVQVKTASIYIRTICQLTASSGYFRGGNKKQHEELKAQTKNVKSPRLLTVGVLAHNQILLTDRCLSILTEPWATTGGAKLPVPAISG